MHVKFIIGGDLFRGRKRTKSQTMKTRGNQTGSKSLAGSDKEVAPASIEWLGANPSIPRITTSRPNIAQKMHLLRPTQINAPWITTLQRNYQSYRRASRLEDSNNSLCYAYGL